VNLERAIGILALLASLAILWSGIKRLKFGTLTGALVSVGELLGIAITIVSLGWLGLLLVAFANALAVLIWSVVLAARVEKQLVAAAIEAGEDKSAMEDLAVWLRRQEPVKAIRPIEQAELIKLLAQRARSADEIKEMAIPIGMLKLIQEPSLDWLVEAFDRLLRLTGKTASDAMEVADTLTVATQQSAGTFTEMVEAMIAVYGGEAPEQSSAAEAA
jgi:hypothetical protein